jgi:acylglycerol lipase
MGNEVAFVGSPQCNSSVRAFLNRDQPDRISISGSGNALSAHGNSTSDSSFSSKHNATVLKGSWMEVRMSWIRAKKIVGAMTAAIGMIGGLTLGQPVLADTVRIDDGQFATMLKQPVYQWQDYQQTPKAIVLAIHGLTQHGTVFDAYARKLAADGVIVVALDMRGYGAWYKDGKHAQINYDQSEKDLCALAVAVRQQYKGLPVFVTGESLGGSMAIRMAAEHAALIDGLILCAPAIKMYHSVPARTLVDAAISLADRDHQLDVSEFVKKDFSEDSQITQEKMSDPLIRKEFGAEDLLNSCRLVVSTRCYIRQIPSSMPVLVLQGEKDLMVKPSGVSVLESSLKSADKTVQLFPRRGHILIETEHVRPDTMKAIISWVDSQCLQYSLQQSTVVTVNGRPDQGG